jgi:chemotaxis protein MotA
MALPKYLIEALTAKKVETDSIVSTIVSMAEKARRDGMLALESEIKGISDPFLRRGLEMAVDGTDTAQIEQILSAEISSTAAADARKAKVFADMAGYAPTIGIIGTVIGLIHVLGNLGDPAELGAQIASAFVATLWGVLSANAFWMPVSNRLKRVSSANVERMEICLEGVLAIQAGANPRLVARKLSSLLPPAPAQKEAA